MSTYNIACCYFPTTVVFVDDHIQSLQNLELALDENLVNKLFSDPIEAINFLKQHNHPLPYIKQWSQNLNRRDDIELGRNLEEKVYTHNYIDTDVPAIHQQIYSADRFKEISVVVVDYSMPSMDGMEFCKRLQKLPIRKIMLTGQASHELGIRAFNKGLIDMFAVKDPSSVGNELNKIIEELRYKYFCNLSDAIIHSLVLNPYSCVGDDAFIELFDNLREQNNIIEYYLVKDTGCFLMLDIDGNPSWLAVKTEQDMRHDLQSAIDNDASDEIVGDLEKRRRIIFQLNDNDVVTYSHDNWQRYSHPATKLQGENGIIYYSFIEGAAGYDIDTTKIAAYQKFLEAN